MKVFRIDDAPASAVYIGRGSPWGNPFRIGRDGDRALVIAKFRAYAEKRMIEEPQWLKPLEGKDVKCFCAPLACHGDVLASLVYKTFCSEECPSFWGGSCQCEKGGE